MQEVKSMRRNEPLYIPLSVDEKAEIKAASDRMAAPLATWARSALLIAARSQLDTNKP